MREAARQQLRTFRVSEMITPAGPSHAFLLYRRSTASWKGGGPTSASNSGTI